MTFVGKVLVVVQLVLSVCFMAFAGAVYTFQTKWQEKYVAVNDQLRDARNELAGIRDRSDKREDLARTILQANTIDFDAGGDVVEQAVEAFRTQVAENDRLARNLATVEQTLDAKSKAFEALEEGLSVAVTETKISGETADAANTRSKLLEQININALNELEAKEANLRGVEDRKFELESSLNRTEKLYNEQLTENARLVALLRANGIEPDAKPPSDNEPPPDVEGLVIATKKNRSTELVEISIGSDDGLREGDDLFVYRSEEGKYLGQIRLVLVTPDRAVGTVTERAPNGLITRGDNVGTKL